MGDFGRDGGGGSVDPVYLQVHGASLQEIFPTSYSAQHHCDLLGSPSEKGTIQYDNKVVKPTTVTFTGILKSRHKRALKLMQKNIRQSRKIGEMMCTLYTKGATYENMILKEVSEVGESNRYDGFEVRVVLEEYLEHN